MCAGVFWSVCCVLGMGASACACMYACVFVRVCVCLWGVWVSVRCLFSSVDAGLVVC